jgi:hypothetical protein
LAGCGDGDNFPKFSHEPILFAMSEPPLEVDWGDGAEVAVPLRTLSFKGKSYVRIDPSDEEYTPPSFSPAIIQPRSVSQNGIGRVLPHSIEAEEYLLSCCLIPEDEGAVLAKAVEARIRVDSFYDPKHGIIFDCLLSLQKQGKPIAIDVVAQELKATKQLDEIGGYAFLTQISSRIPTTAQAGYFIEKVREQSLLREIIRSANNTVESAYNFSGGIEEFMSEAQSRLKCISDGSIPPTRSPLIGLTDFQIVPDGDASILLGNRYLNRGEGAVLSGTSGMGKSSMSIQTAILFALGRPAFGIPPNGQLRSLIVQSEDSEGDVAEMQFSVCHAMKLSTLDRATVGSLVKVWTERVLRGDKFLAALRRKIEEFKPDLVWLNPLQAFVVGDITKGEDLSRFLREGLNGLNPNAFGYIIVHHTTKPATGKDKAERLWHEVMYDMAGGAEIINWARAILSLRPMENEGEFNLILAKRGRRAGVIKEVEQGAGVRFEPCTTIPLRHAKGFIPAAQLGLKKDLPLIFWESREPDPKSDKPSESKNLRAEKFSFSDYRNLMPPHSSEGMELAPLAQRLSVNKTIKREILHGYLKQWEVEGGVEIIALQDQPMRYRLKG